MNRLFFTEGKVLDINDNKILIKLFGNTNGELIYKRNHDKIYDLEKFYLNDIEIESKYLNWEILSPSHKIKLEYK